MVTAEKRSLQIEARLKDFLSRDLSKMEGRLVRFATYGAAGLKKLVGATFNLKTALGGLLAGYGALQAVSLVRRFGEEADAILKLAASTGDLVENISELQAAFNLAGIGAGEFDGTVRALLTAQRKAVDGSDGMRDAFADLGITLTDLQTLAPSALFERIAAGLGELSDEQERALALGRLLPRQFLALLPILGGGVTKFQEAIREARAVGATITESQARVAERLNDAFTKIDISLRGVGVALIEAFGPEAIALLERVAKGITENKEAVVGLAAAIGKGVVAAVSLAVDALIGLIGVIESIPGVDLIDSTALDAEIKKAKQQLTDLAEARDPGAARRRQQEAAQRLVGTAFDPARQSQLGNFGLGRGFDAGAAAAQQQFQEWEQRVKREAEAIVSALGPQEQAIRDRIATLEVTLRDGISGALAKTKQQLSDELSKVAQQVRGDTGAAVSDAVAPTDPQAEAWKAYAENMGAAMSKIEQDSRAAGEAANSVFRPTKGGSLPQEIEQESPDRTRERLAILQQIGGLAADLEPVQQALLDIEQQQVVLALQDAKDKGTINAKELADAVAFVNAQFERTRSVIGGGNFFDGFSQGARKALRAWTDFTAAGQEAAATLVDGGLNGLTDAFADIITGTKSAKEAFKDFAKQMLADLARIISKLIVMKTLETIFGAEKGGVLPMEKGGMVAMASGGTVNRNGGIARRPTVLFGEGRTAEAFVPLPDNRSIPVSFVGGGGGGEQVVNISITAMDSRDVQRVLLEQQGTLRTIFTNQANTKSGMRQVIAGAAR